jgi:hypothetical protein
MFEDVLDGERCDRSRHKVDTSSLINFSTPNEKTLSNNIGLIITTPNHSSDTHDHHPAQTDAQTKQAQLSRKADQSMGTANIIICENTPQPTPQGGAVWLDPKPDERNHAGSTKNDQSVFGGR